MNAYSARPIRNSPLSAAEFDHRKFEIGDRIECRFLGLSRGRLDKQYIIDISNLVVSEKSVEHIITSIWKLCSVCRAKKSASQRESERWICCRKASSQCNPHSSQIDRSQELPLGGHVAFRNYSHNVQTIDEYVSH